MASTHMVARPPVPTIAYRCGALIAEEASCERGTRTLCA
jgi:hypothetical protein